VALLWPASIAWVVGLRALAQFAFARLRGQRPPVERVAIIGSGVHTERLAEHLRGLSEGIRLLGRIDLGRPRDGAHGALTALGHVGNLEAVIERHQLNHLILTDDALPADSLASLARTCRTRGVSVHKLVDTPREATSGLWIANGVPLVDIVTAQLSTGQQIAKRTVDVVLGVPLLIASLPVIALLALVVRLESPGPVFFRQLRRGRGGRYFAMLKLRSMRDGAEDERDDLDHHNESNGALFKMRRDPRVTRVGYLLRKYSLDELPQLFNVLRGEMSLVGPRPLPIQDVEGRLDQPSLRYWIERREDVLPGITGLWQVCGRSELDFDEMLVLDIHYIRHWSLGADLEILVRTIPAVLGTRGAY
jgi:exopolysaccharide biosynthesis polyprenyl glycosylphosphotransferase